MTAAEEEEVGRVLARWLAPYLVEELDRPRAASAVEVAGRYDDATCAEYVRSLGDVVLLNAQTFFTLLAEEGEVGSLALAAAIGVSGPRSIPAVLTTPLKRRAKALALPNPWREDEHDDRTLWLDHDQTASRMTKAITAETARRTKRGGE